MERFNGVELVFKDGEKRPNLSYYYSLKDLTQDLTTNCLLDLLKSSKKFMNQMTIYKEIETRNEIEEDLLFDLLEDYCNGY